VQDSTSVLMVESAALALASSLCGNMNLEHLNLYTDSQLLVDCINGPDPSNPRTGGSSLLLKLFKTLWIYPIRCARFQELKIRWLIHLREEHFIVCFLFSLLLLFHVLILPIFKGARMHSNL
jgi:hypothetical protein